jgi:hypothetical protein
VLLRVTSSHLTHGLYSRNRILCAYEGAMATASFQRHVHSHLIATRPEVVC